MGEFCREVETSKPTEAEQVFESFLERWYRQEVDSIESEIAKFPALADELRHLHREWVNVVGILDRCRLTESFSSRLRREYGQEINPDVELAVDVVDTVQAPPSYFDDGAVNTPDADVLDRLGAPAQVRSRYAFRGEIGRGGMGAVFRVWDGDLRRHLAMKVILPSATAASSGARSSPADLARFLEEAQVNGQLDHPGIVPVHELG